MPEWVEPMHVNYGIIPPLDRPVKGKREKNLAVSQRALAWIDARRSEIMP